MSNRDYVGFLEGKSEKERMDSALHIVRDYVDEAIEVYLKKIRKSDKTEEEILAEEKEKVGETERDIFSEIGTRKLADILPELAHKYEIIVGFLNEKIHVGYRVKPSHINTRTWADGTLDFNWLNTETGNIVIGGNTITAGTIDTTRITTGHIAGSGFNYSAQLREQMPPFNVQIGNTVYQGANITVDTPTNFDDETRRRVIRTINESAWSTGVVNTNAQGWVRNT